MTTPEEPQQETKTKYDPQAIFAAVQTATTCHSGQFRKGTHVPYIVHPLGVAEILIHLDCHQALVLSAILHDTLEDTRYTAEELRMAFGDEVLRLVLSVSEPDKGEPWPVRKRHTLQVLRESDTDVLLLSCADKLHNARSIRSDLDRSGNTPAFWGRFNRPFPDQAWYYGSLADLFESRRDGFRLRLLAKEFRHVVDSIFCIPAVQP